MRQVKEFDTAGGKRYRVRYRQGEKQTSETFRDKRHAKTFAAMLDSAPGNDGVLAALQWLRVLESDLETATFAEWFEVYVNQLTGVAPRTRADYRKMRARYLSELDELPLPLITRGHVTSIVNRLENEGLSAKTVKNVLHMLSSCLGLAVEEGHIGRNPCRKVKPPKPGIDGAVTRFLTEDELGDLYKAVNPYYRPLVAFLVGTGLRWSEATALRRSDVDVERGTVRVERAWKWAGAGKGWVIGAPKSARSRRTVNAASVAIAAVARLEPAEFLFVTPSGVPVRHNNFYSRVWKPAVDAAFGHLPERERPRIHDLRHTHASWLISAGVSLEAVQDQLGHESILTTRKVYGHLLPAVGVEVGRVASETLGRALAAALAAPDTVQLLELGGRQPESADSPEGPPQ